MDSELCSYGENALSGEWNIVRICLLRQTLNLRRLTSIQLLKERFRLSTQFHKTDYKQESHRRARKARREIVLFRIIQTSAASHRSVSPMSRRRRPLRLNKENLER
jgi:hypothetical protein